MILLLSPHCEEFVKGEWWCRRYLHHPVYRATSLVASGWLPLRVRVLLRRTHEALVSNPLVGNVVRVSSRYCYFSTAEWIIAHSRHVDGYGGGDGDGYLDEREDV